MTAKGLRALVLACLVAASGCATLVGGGSNQVVSIEATPSNARYTVRSSSGIQMSSGSVPASIRLPRKNEYQVDITLDGYETATLAMSRGTNGWIWGNLLFGWIVGFIVDFATGSAYKLEPALINVTLERGDTTIAVVDILDRDGQLIDQQRLPLTPKR